MASRELSVPFGAAPVKRGKQAFALDYSTVDSPRRLALGRSGTNEAIGQAAQLHQRLFQLL